MPANPRKIDSAGLDEFINGLNTINTGIQELRRKEPKYFISIEGREEALAELQTEIRNTVNHLAVAADALEGSLQEKRELFYPGISGSIRSLRNALKQFQSLKMDDLSQTGSPLQQPGRPEKLQEDKDKLDEIQTKLNKKNPRDIKESSELDGYITDLLAVSVNSEMFRNHVPKYFRSIDALQQNIRDAVDNLATAADVLDKGNLYDKKDVFYPKIRDTIPLLNRAYSQFQLPEMEDRSQTMEGA